MPQEVFQKHLNEDADQDEDGDLEDVKCRNLPDKNFGMCYTNCFNMLHTSNILNKYRNMSKEKPTFEDYVKKYVQVDNEIETLQGKLKVMKEWRRKLNGVIVKHMEDQNLVDHTLEISDGTLRYYEKKEYSSMSFTYIEKCLQEMISEPDQVKYVIQYLKDQREVKYVPELKRRKYSSDNSSDSENEE